MPDFCVLCVCQHQDRQASFGKPISVVYIMAAPTELAEFGMPSTCVRQRWKEKEHNSVTNRYSLPTIVPVFTNCWPRILYGYTHSSLQQPIKMNVERRQHTLRNACLTHRRRPTRRAETQEAFRFRSKHDLYIVGVRLLGDAIMRPRPDCFER